MADDSDWTKFGRYALLENIGSGGMAEIYRAKTFGAAGFEKEFAIKLINPSLVDDTEFVEMFINEAKIVVNLYHANIVQVFDLGEIEGQYYIAMEYVRGKDLLDILARCAEKNLKIPLNLVLFIGMEMLKGLNFAHNATDPYGEDLEIIHRDVSPANILVSYAGDVKVGDFGVAKAAIQRSLTENDTLKGKVGYMSPEQVQGGDIDARSDIFSAGIVFFEALSMSRLFVGDSDLDVMLKVRDAEVEEALDQADPIPPDLEEIVRRALTRDPEERFQSAGDFYQALVDFCYKHQIKVDGNDLSDLMTSLFADEIEEEKTKRRDDPEAPSPEAFGAQTSSASSTVSSTIDDDRGPELPDQGDVAPGGEQESTRKGHASESTDAEEDGERSTLDHDTEDDTSASYRFRDASGRVEGPMEWQGLVDTLSRKRPDPDDRISVDGGAWKPPDEVDGVVDEVPKYGGLSRGDAPKASGPSKAPRPESFQKSGGGTDPVPEAGFEQTDVEEEEGEVRLEADSDIEDSVKELEQLSVASTKQDDEGPDFEDQLPDIDQDFDRKQSPVDVQNDDDSMDVLRESGKDVNSITELKDQYASYEGRLQETPFPRLLARLHLGDATGRLHVYNDKAEKSIFVEEGEPIMVDSSKDDELLGSFLKSKGIIDQEQLDQALDRLHEWGGRLGDALVAIGAVPAHDIYELLSEQMREKLLDIFGWRRGEYGYYEGQEPDTKGYPLGIDAMQIVVKGCRNRVPFGHLVDYYEGRTDVPIYQRDEIPVDLDELGLTTRETKVLQAITDAGTLGELLDEFPATQKSQVYRIVYLLEQLEAIDFDDTDQHPLPDL